MSEAEKNSFGLLVDCYPKHNKLILVKKYITNRYDMGDLRIDMKMIAEEPQAKKKDDQLDAKAKKQARQKTLKKIEEKYKEKKSREV